MSLDLNFTVDNAIFYNLPRHEQQILRAKFRDPLFQKFLQAQIDGMRELIMSNDPGNAKTPEEYLQFAKGQRLILQFWINFLDFARDWGKERGDQL